MKQKIIFSEYARSDLADLLGKIDFDFPNESLFVLTDENTRRQCWPLLRGEPWPPDHPVLINYAKISCARSIVIPAGEAHKNLESVAQGWEALQRGGATRHSLLVNLGGGMVCDLGGFAASTFKRGIRFVNIPTTLLAMVDASVGGKTGVNFGGLKNEIGTFCEPQAVIIDTRFLDTLDRENLLSGYAEMLKHSLLDTVEHWAEMLNDSSTIEKSIAVKQRIVEADPHENGLRKALNLGHTFGHAFESITLEKSSPNTQHSTPLLHGYAVAYGLICELYLSVVKCGFPTEKMRQTVQFIREKYGSPSITCDDYPELIRLMQHDKKNIGDTIRFTLLADIGDIRLDQTATHEEIREALDFLREG
ncbi:MAG: 3-dehydroquinate synthase [Prevotella sp.]|nr:3-dehydroquinate synthase [Prevotella sp.]